MKKIIIIDGNNFSDLEGFYADVDRVFTKDLNFETGHNLDAFNDILYGGFGVHEDDEPIKLIWSNFEKSKIDLGKQINSILEIIDEHKDIEFVIS